MRGTSNWFAGAATVVPALLLGLTRPAAGQARVLPAPGVGVFFKADEVPGLREKIKKAPCKATYENLNKVASAGLTRWPGEKAKLRLAELAHPIARSYDGFCTREVHAARWVRSR